MSDLIPTVELFFDLPASGGDYFTIGDATKGELDGSFGLVGDEGTPSDIGDHSYDVLIRRGRSYELDDFQVGTCSVQLRNYDGRFLPSGLDTDGLATYGSDAIRPGRRCRITVEGVTVFDGSVEDWNFSYDRDGRVDADIFAEDALASLARTAFTEWTPTDEQLPGARIEAALNRSEVSFGSSRAIDAGRSPLQAGVVAAETNVLTYLNLVSRSDLGRLFCSRAGVLTFRDRATLAGESPTVTFGSGSLSDVLITEDANAITTEDAVELVASSTNEVSGYPINRLAVQYGSEVLYTRVTVARDGGTIQTAGNDGAQDTYGVRTLALSQLLLSYDEAAADMAAFLLSQYASPRFRFRQVSVQLDTLADSDRATVLALELGDVVNVVWSPVGMDAAAQQTLTIEGITISVSSDGASAVVFDLAPRLQGVGFVVEDDTYGALDGVGALTY